MIKFESNLLIVDATISRDDIDAINAFVEHCKEQAVEEYKATIKTTSP